MQLKVIQPIMDKFPYHYGSHSTRLYHKEEMIEWVSIPLWFSLNMYVTYLFIKALMGFHTTMVLTQHGEVARIGFGIQMFPYHYGSHSTGIRHG